MAERYDLSYERHDRGQAWLWIAWPSALM